MKYVSIQSRAVAHTAGATVLAAAIFFIVNLEFNA